MSMTRRGNVRSHDIGAIFEEVGAKLHKRKAKGGRGTSGAYPMGIRREVMFNMDYLGRVMMMYTTIPGFQFARRAMHARVFCETFKVHFKNWPGSEDGGSKSFDEEGQNIIDRYWMDALRTVYDYREAWGFCPYVWEHIEGTNHYYPRVPIPGTYILSFEEDRDGREFRLYWVDDLKPEEAEDVFWVRGDQEPDGGILRTAVASLLADYDLYLTNLNAHFDAIPNGAHPFHMLEHHPKQASDLGEVQEQYMAFGDQAALAAMRHREVPRQMREGVRRDQLMAALHHAHDANYGKGWPADEGEADYNSSQAGMDRTHGAFLQRTVALDSDFQYKSAAQSVILMPLSENWRKLNQDAANALGFPLEFAQSTSAQRSANVQGNTRYINENVKCMIRDYKFIVKRMFLVSPYGRTVLKLNEIAKRENAEILAKAGKGKKGRGKISRDDKKATEAKPPKRRFRKMNVTEPSRAIEYKLHKMVDVEVEFSHTPEMSYQQLRELLLDNVIDSHANFVKQAGNMFGLPESVLTKKGNHKLMEQEQMDISKRDAREKWKHQDEALKWHEARMRAVASASGGEGGGGGAGQVQLPPGASSTAMSAPPRATRLPGGSSSSSSTPTARGSE